MMHALTTTDAEHDFVECSDPNCNALWCRTHHHWAFPHSRDCTKGSGYDGLSPVGHRWDRILLLIVALAALFVLSYLLVKQSSAATLDGALVRQLVGTGAIGLALTPTKLGVVGMVGILLFVALAIALGWGTP